MGNPNEKATATQHWTISTHSRLELETATAWRLLHNRPRLNGFMIVLPLLRRSVRYGIGALYCKVRSGRITSSYIRGCPRVAPVLRRINLAWQCASWFRRRVPPAIAFFIGHVQCIGDSDFLKAPKVQSLTDNVPAAAIGPALPPAKQGQKDRSR